MIATCEVHKMPMLPTGWSFCIIVGDYSVYASSVVPTPIFRTVTWEKSDIPPPILPYEHVPQPIREKALDMILACQNFTTMLNTK